MAKERCIEVTIEEVESLCYSDIDEEASDSEDEIDFVDDSSTGTREKDDIICHKGMTFKSIKTVKIKDYDVKSRTFEKSLQSDGINAVDSIKKNSDVKKNKESTETSTGQKNRGLVYACMHDGCEKVFSRPSRLSQHIRTHTGEVSTQE